MWKVIWCSHDSNCCLGRQFAVHQEVGDLEIAGLLGQLLDRIAAVLEDAFVAVDVGDRRSARGGVEEGRVVDRDPGLVRHGS